MLYAVLIYDLESEVGNLSDSEMAKLIANHERVQQKLAAEKKLGPVARLMPTTSAMTLKQRENLVVDGPFAETKEQLLGFYMIDCASQEEALQEAKLIGGACNARTLEVRPVQLFYPGIGLGKVEPERFVPRERAEQAVG
jgi:hypothetical protein